MRLAAILALAFPACSLLYQPDPDDLPRRDAGEDTVEDGFDAPDGLDAPDGADQDVAPECQTFVVSLPNAGADILVVVDNSMGMIEEQTILTNSFITLATELMDPGEGSEPITDMHIGVVSTDMGVGSSSITGCTEIGDDGVLLHDPSPSVTGCDTSYPLFLATTSMSTPAVVAQDFECIATLGADGCGFERPLNAARRALVDHRDGANAGFLRDDSLLLILFITDENDCSVSTGNEDIYDASFPGLPALRCFEQRDVLEAVQNFVRAYEGLRADRRKIQLGCITGVPPGAACEGSGDLIAACLDEPEMLEVQDDVDPNRLRFACNTTFGTATPGRRLVEMAQAFGSRAIVGSSCNASYVETMSSLVTKLQNSYAAINEHGLPDWDRFPVHSDPGDECLCMSDCTVREILSDDRGCTTPKTYVETREERGNSFTVCEIPQAGARLRGCEGTCNDRFGNFDAQPDGWYYHPPTAMAGFLPILFSENTAPDPGSFLEIECCF